MIGYCAYCGVAVSERTLACDSCMTRVKSRLQEIEDTPVVIENEVDRAVAALEVLSLLRSLQARGYQGEPQMYESLRYCVVSSAIHDYDAKTNQGNELWARIDDYLNVLSESHADDSDSFGQAESVITAHERLRNYILQKGYQ